ncbi:MAG TPA: hypothetical protein PK867_16255 [Pirellulales bacterium]|nr:hypothetical protein [Pirellulales bacterium]
MRHFQQRLRAAEKEGRRWRRTTCALAVSCLAVAFMAAKKHEVIVPELVIARKFVALNERGQPVAIMGHAKNVGLLGVSAADGSLMFVATSTDDGRGVVCTYNHLGRQLVEIGSDKSGHGSVSTSHRDRGLPIANRPATGTASQRSGG